MDSKRPTPRSQLHHHPLHPALPAMSSSPRAGDEVPIAGACVRDQAVEGAVVVEHNAVRAGRAAGVDVVAGQDGELVPRARRGEREVLVIVVLVRVVVCAVSASVSVRCQPCLGPGDEPGAVEEGSMDCTERGTY